MGNASACKDPKRLCDGKEDVEKSGPTMTEMAAFAVVQQASLRLEEDEKKNAAQFATDPSFLAALVDVIGQEELTMEERGTAALVVRTLAKRSAPFKATFRDSAGLPPLVG